MRIIYDLKLFSTPLSAKTKEFHKNWPVHKPFLVFHFSDAIFLRAGAFNVYGYTDTMWPGNANDGFREIYNWE